MASLHVDTQIAILTLADPTFEKERMEVDQMILHSTAAGIFSILLDNTTLTMSTSAAELCRIIPMKRRLNKVTLVSGPAGAMINLFLEQGR